MIHARRIGATDAGRISPNQPPVAVVQQRGLRRECHKRLMRIDVPNRVECRLCVAALLDEAMALAVTEIKMITMASAEPNRGVP